MKHYIIAKFKDKEDTERLFPEVRQLFCNAEVIPGVEKVLVHKSNSDRDNSDI